MKIMKRWPRIGFAAVLLMSSQLPAAAAERDPRVERWLEKQAAIQAWSAEVVQTRKVATLVRPLSTPGRVWFRQPNEFRWQLGEPARSLAVRSGNLLTIAYPRLRRAELYGSDSSAELDEGWRQALALLEVGFPRDAALFFERYRLLSVQESEGKLRFELEPAATEARRLLSGVAIEVSSAHQLLATELSFPDGSTMRNDFANLEAQSTLPDDLFELDLTGYEVSKPLDR